MTPVLSTDLWVDYPQKSGVLCGARIDVMPGEVLGLVGQSGSGKSTLAMAILGLLGRASVRGTVSVNGQNLIGRDERYLRHVRGRLVSLIPQAPVSALNPALRLETQVREAWIAHARSPWKQQIGAVKQMLGQAGLPTDDEFLRRFPDQISIGQAQRVLIVMSLLHSPVLVIADEPTSALDMITQREIRELIRRISVERNMSVLFISHDLLSVASVCRRVAILHEGVIVECRPIDDILRRPQHAYTEQLVAAVPKWPLG